jgi:ATP-binding cassette subfamily B protein
MTDIPDEHDGAPKRRTLGNAEVLAFVWRWWMRRPARFTGMSLFFLAATACDLSIPWAARALIEAVSDPARRADAAWSAWAALTGLYVAFYASRLSAFRVMNGFSSRNMEDLTNAGFRRVQQFSTDWHANTFAGATVRQLSRGMWGFDVVTDTLVIMLAPALIVLVGLSIGMFTLNPLAGAISLVIVAAYMATNVLLAAKYVRPVNLRSTALDSRIGASLADAITNNPAVKSFGAEEREVARFGRVTEAWRKAVIATWNRFNVVGLVMNVFLVALQAAVTGLLVRAWAAGEASPGDVAFAITSSC